MEPDRSTLSPEAWRLYVRATRGIRVDALLLGTPARGQWIADASLGIYPLSGLR